ncbi:MAG: sensor hybrid histidine kinase, partial [Verrucomicrobiaceae bacterium]|nr:sensor hybrid histidine kinase [Verrucomicrobiaceae bacterium]
ESKQLTVKLDHASPDTLVRGDAVRLQQVLWNVLKNAVKFTPVNGSISVRSSVEAGFLHIECADSGMGITASEMPRIFDAFSQGDEASEARFGGLGLGLSISALLMKEHGGGIWAESPGRGKGSVFHLTVPLASPALVKSVKQAAKADALRSLRILLVEDHCASRNTLSRLLKRRGHEVSCAENLATARKLASTQKFDVLISDLGLPDGSGHDLMIELRRQWKLPGIALSGYGTSADVERSAKAGFFEHLTKPVDIHGLEEALARVFTEPSAGAPS